MGYTTKSNSYVLGKNLGIIEDKAVQNLTTFNKGSKVTESGVYEITFSYAVRNTDTTSTGSCFFYIGFGTYISTASGSWLHKGRAMLSADNQATQDFANQRPVTISVTKTTDVELDFMCQTNTDIWDIYNIHAVAKKIADI